MNDYSLGDTAVMSTTANNPFILDLTDSYGPILIGSLFSCVLWGVSCMQMCAYLILRVVRLGGADPSHRFLYFFKYACFMDTHEHVLNNAAI